MNLKEHQRNKQQEDENKYVIQNAQTNLTQSEYFAAATFLPYPTKAKCTPFPQIPNVGGT